MNALITGVTGFAGGHLAEHLLAEGDRVAGASLSTDWPPESPASLAAVVPVIEWDIATDPSAVTMAAIEALAPKCIYHLAAISVPGECGADEPTSLAKEVNVEGTLRVIRLAAALPSRPRVLFTSSSHVYAPVSAETPSVGEDAPLGPRGGYGKTKLAAEKGAAKLAGELDVELVVARSFQHTGPRQTGPMMLAEWIEQVVAGRDPIRVQSCHARIDVCDVRDVARGYRLLALRGEAGKVYNVGGGRGLTSGAVLEVLLGGLDSPPEVEELNPTAKQDPIADITRLTVATGWQPAISIEQTVADALAWQRSRDVSTN